MSAKRHIFCIGLPKTCLTSLLKFMKQNGFDGEGRNSEVFKQFMRGEYDAVMDYYDTKEFTCGFPAQFMYKCLFEKYGKDARFILTHRKDGPTWYRSICRHNRYAHPFRNKHKWIFGRYYSQGFESEHVAFYDRHQQKVLNYFTAQDALDQLLVIDCTRPDGVEKLEDFLGFSAVEKGFPHKNKGNEVRDGGSNSFKFRYNRVSQAIYGTVAPTLFKKPAATLRAIDPAEIRSH